MIDIHAHINDNKLIENVTKVIENAKNAGVDKIVCVGDDIKSSQKAIELANKFPCVYAVIGVHPTMLDCFDKDAELFLEQNASNKKVIAIGEIGLDYHDEPYDKERQKNCFIKQLEIASKVNLPIEIHMRDATFDTIEILKNNKHLLKNGGILHCYSGSIETFNIIKELGLSVSVGGIITFKNARSTLDVTKEIPIENILLETDCPYLAPHPHRGEINEPMLVKLTAEKIAEIKGLSVDEVDKITTENAYRVFPKLK